MNTGPTGDVSRLNPADLWRLAESFSLQLRRSNALGIGGRRHVGQREAGTDFDGYQPYRSGDDLRHVDWSVYGRNRKLFVRRFRDDRSGVLVVLLDASGSMSLGSPSKWAYARALGSVVTLAALRELHHVVLGVINGNEVQVLPDIHGLESGTRVIDFLTSIEPSGTTDLDGAMCELLGSTRNADVVVVSDFLDPLGGHAGLTNAAQGVGSLHLIRVSALHEFDLPDDGGLLVDPEELNRPLRRVDEGLKARFAARLATHRGHVEEAALGAGASLLDASTDGSLMSVLERIFRELGPGARSAG